MSENWSWQKAGADVVGVQTYELDTPDGVRFCYRVQIRRSGSEPENFVQRFDQDPFATREDALAAGRREGERQYFGLPS